MIYLKQRIHTFRRENNLIENFQFPAIHAPARQVPTAGPRRIAEIPG